MSMRSTQTLFLVGCLCILMIPFGGTVAMADELPPVVQPTLADRWPDFFNVMRTTSLASLPSQGEPLALFQEVIGPRLGLNDAALAVGAKRLSPAMSKELMIDDLKQSASELMRGLAAWQLAQEALQLHVIGTSEQLEEFHRRVEAQTAWLTEGTPLKIFLHHLSTRSKDLASQVATQDTAAGSVRTGTTVNELAEAASAVEPWAKEIVHREWFRLFTWKDQVRRQRGLVRLCGTWQWSIHNHQNHREEKTAVIFAPPGATSPTNPAEISVLGDSVYLRWETQAGVQEDSLLFSAEGQRLEGTFVNNAGGWGSITGKRTASCVPKGGEKPASGQRRSH